MEGMQEKVGICPQINLHFEALTVKENLRIFAHIKGIQWKEVDEEVGMSFSVTDSSFMASWALFALFIKSDHLHLVLWNENKPDLVPKWFSSTLLSSCHELKLRLVLFISKQSHYG